MKLFGALPATPRVARLPSLRRIRKPVMRHIFDREMLSYMYRVEPGPGSKEVVEIVQRFFQLRQSIYPAMTLPEGIYYYLCEKHEVEFIYQEDFLGGRKEIGGAVFDFVLPDYGVVVYINGLFWHEKPDVKERDLAAMMMVIGETVAGVKISSAVRVSDVRIQSIERNDIFRLSLSGVEVYP